MPNPIVVATVIFNLKVELHAFGLASMLVSACVYPRYIWEMVKGHHRPPRSSWFLWFLLDGLAFSSNLVAGTFDAMLFIYTLGTIFVSIATIWYGKPEWSRFETVCAVTVLGVVAIWMTIGPSVALVCSMIGITAAFLPLLLGVLRGAYEDPLSWAVALFGGILNLVDGQWLVSLWFIALQAIVLAALGYHHWYVPRRRQGELFAS